jgi:hypothetical protein
MYCKVRVLTAFHGLMEHYVLARGGNMKQSQIHSVPRKAGDLTFDDLYDEISSHWQDKAKKLQIRRGRAMKQAVRDGRY